MADDTAKPKFGFIFNSCNDVAAMRRFYVDLLGLKEAAFLDSPDFAYLSVEAGGLQAMWFRADDPVPAPSEFAEQPGWEGGTLQATSWAVFIPEHDFDRVRRELVASGARLFDPEPEWRQDCYLGLSVLDPMGATVEVYTVPAGGPPTRLS
jgi:catechol 2,3-dioxygenase-like lactoylglutathione lyase family enzyme